MKNVLDQITARLVNEFNPESIFLFGSRAWGNPTADSDVDILVIVKDSPISAIKRASQAYRSLRGIPVPTDVLVKTKAEMERFSGAASSLEYLILSKGRKLYG